MSEPANNTSGDIPENLQFKVYHVPSQGSLIPELPNYSGYRGFVNFIVDPNEDPSTFSETLFSKMPTSISFSVNSPAEVEDNLTTQIRALSDSISQDDIDLELVDPMINHVTEQTTVFMGGLENIMLRHGTIDYPNSWGTECAEDYQSTIEINLCYLTRVLSNGIAGYDIDLSEANEVQDNTGPDGGDYVDEIFDEDTIG